MHCIFSAICACAKKRDYTVCLNRNGATLNHSFTDLLIPRCFWLKYNLDRSTAYLVRPPDHGTIHFMPLRCCCFNHLVIRDLRRVSHRGPLLILLVPLSIKYFLHHQNLLSSICIQIVYLHLSEPSEHADCPGSTQQRDPVVEGGQSSSAEDWTFMG